MSKLSSVSIQKSRTNLLDIDLDQSLYRGVKTTRNEVDMYGKETDAEGNDLPPVRKTIDTEQDRTKALLLL